MKVYHFLFFDFRHKNFEICQIERIDFVNWNFFKNLYRVYEYDFHRILSILNDVVKFDSNFVFDENVLLYVVNEIAKNSKNFNSHFWISKKTCKCKQIRKNVTFVMNNQIFIRSIMKHCFVRCWKFIQKRKRIMIIARHWIVFRY